MLWDPTRISGEKLIIPLSYFFLIQHFDGNHSLEELAGLYLKKFGEFLNPEQLQTLVSDLDEKLFLEGDRFDAAKAKVQAEFREAPVRKPMFAGKHYPNDPNQLQSQLDSFYSSKEGPEIKPSENKGKKIHALVAPQFELREAGPVYAWAYKELKEADSPKTFILLGNCHTGLDHFYALTDKDFETPFGVIRNEKKIIEHFRNKPEHEIYFEGDISHQQEHGIEFQLPFLQHTLGLDCPITIVPILCSFPPSSIVAPEFQDEKAAIDTFIASLKDTLGAFGKDVCLLTSAELAHLGMRYGAQSPPTDFSFHQCMQHDLEMLKHAEDIQPQELAQYIAKEGDQRNIWGFAPLYTMLRLLEGTEGIKGQVLRYDRGITDQYNSTVTYASMAFF